MTSNPLSLPASDLPVREAEHLLNDNKFQGFPIVEDRASKILVGYVGRTELRYAIGKARRVQPLSPNAKCIFTYEAAVATARTRSPATPAHFHDAPQTFDELENSTGSKSVDFTPYVDHTPISVHPRLPLETVMELFKKMGPRVILVEQRGRLMGLVTVKDCLKYQFKVEAQENTTTANGASASGAHWASGANGHGGENQGSVATLEEKVWSFLQKVGQSLRLLKTRSIRLEESARSARPTSGRHDQSAETTDEHQSGGILDGTEEDAPVELEDRVR